MCNENFNQLPKEIALDSILNQSVCDHDARYVIKPTNCKLSNISVLYALFIYFKKKFRKYYQKQELVTSQNSNVRPTYFILIKLIHGIDCLWKHWPSKTNIILSSNRIQSERNDEAKEVPKQT